MINLASLIQELERHLKIYKREYFDFIYYRYRNFDIKGLSVQGSFNLEQQEVYIDPKLSPIDMKELTTGTLLEKATQSNEKGRWIWEFIDKAAKSGNKVVIVGDPGSGKTTVLKQIALALCISRNKYRLPRSIPIILFLRNHVEQIIRHADVSLIDLNRSSLESSGFKSDDNFFRKRLVKGACVILLDGIDEIGKATYRKEVVCWIEKQMQLYANNHFIITTRPHGILNNPINGAELFRIKPLDLDQIETFIYRWYLANEARRSLKLDRGVEMLAKEGSQDLLNRIQNTEPLQPLAQNPLLLTMIALVHRFNAQLPGRRVELYDEIFRVFFRRREEVVGLDYSLTSEQSRGVLVPLANYMMQNEIRDIEVDQAVEIIKKDLADISKSSLEPKDFLKSVEQQSGLVRDLGGGMYAFASLTFQEYLASIYYVNTKEVDTLIKEIPNTWWWETIRLYSAQEDATKIIAACLNKKPLDLSHLQLAIYCLEEALRVEQEVNSQLNEIINTRIEDPDPAWRNMIASAILLKRLRWMRRIDARRLIDLNTITNVEYQIFIDEEAEKGNYYYPDHWTANRFPKGMALQPVVGVRIDDAKKFCSWLIPRDIWRYHYRLPTTGEDFLHPYHSKDGVEYWVTDGEDIRTTKAKRYVTAENREIIVEQMAQDVELFSAMRAALERERNVKTTRELLSAATEMSGRSYSTRQDQQSSLGEMQSLKLRDDEARRHKEYYLLEQYRRSAQLFGLELEVFLEAAKSVYVSKEHSKTYDWLPRFPLLPEKGYDLAKAQLAFDEKYPASKLVHMAGRKAEIPAHFLRIVEKALLSRNWPQIDQSEGCLETHRFTRSVVRMALLTIAYLVQSNKKDIEQETLQRDIADLYLVYSVLEKRIEGKIQPVEGIRIVKHS